MTFSLNDIYIERCDKETEEVVAKEEQSYFKNPITLLKQRRNEFLYIESPSFDQLKVDSISIELDDVFETYTALFGLKIQKKHFTTIKTFLEEHFQDGQFSALFSNEDGLWEINIPIDFIEGFTEEMTFEEVFTLIYNLLMKLGKTIEA